jgi:hypothetical protein
VTGGDELRVGIVVGDGEEGMVVDMADGSMRTLSRTDPAVQLVQVKTEAPVVAESREADPRSLRELEREQAQAEQWLAARSQSQAKPPPSEHAEATPPRSDVVFSWPITLGLELSLVQLRGTWSAPEYVVEGSRLDDGEAAFRADGVHPLALLREPIHEERLAVVREASGSTTLSCTAEGIRCGVNDSANPLVTSRGAWGALLLRVIAVESPQGGSEAAVQHRSSRQRVTRCVGVFCLRDLVLAVAALNAREGPPFVALPLFSLGPTPHHRSAPWWFGPTAEHLAASLVPPRNPHVLGWAIVRLRVFSPSSISFQIDMPTAGPLHTPWRDIARGDDDAEAAGATPGLENAQAAEFETAPPMVVPLRAAGSPDRPSKPTRRAARGGVARLAKPSSHAKPTVRAKSSSADYATVAVALTEGDTQLLKQAQDFIQVASTRDEARRLVERLRSIVWKEQAECQALLVKRRKLTRQFERHSAMLSQLQAAPGVLLGTPSGREPPRVNPTLAFAAVAVHQADSGRGGGALAAGEDPALWELPTVTGRSSATATTMGRLQAACSKYHAALRKKMLQRAEAAATTLKHMHESERLEKEKLALQARVVLLRRRQLWRKSDQRGSKLRASLGRLGVAEQALILGTTPGSSAVFEKLVKELEQEQRALDERQAEIHGLQVSLEAVQGQLRVEQEQEAQRTKRRDAARQELLEAIDQVRKLHSAPLDKDEEALAELKSSTKLCEQRIEALRKRVVPSFQGGAKQTTSSG